MLRNVVFVDFIRGFWYNLEVVFPEVRMLTCTACSFVVSLGYRYIPMQISDMHPSLVLITCDSFFLASCFARAKK